MNTVDERLETLEKEVSGIKKLLNQGVRVKDWRTTFGMSRNDSEFEEMIRLGREIRESERESEG